MSALTLDRRDVARELARRYSTMTYDELDMLESVLKPRKFPKGATILAQGDICTDIYWVVKGLVRQSYIKNDKELTEYMAVENHIVLSIESLFKEIPTKTKIQAIESSIVYSMPRILLEQVAMKSVNIQILYRKILEEALIRSQIHADMMRFESAQDRYIRFVKMHPQLVLRAPLAYIASYLQMTPETLSRVRSTILVQEK